MATNYFLHLLPHFLGVDNQQRKYAEEQYQHMILTSPQELLSQMLDVIQNSSDDGYRTMTAVLLRGLIIRESDLFQSFENTIFSQFRSALLSATIYESIPLVQRQLAHVLAALAQKEPWPELLNSLPDMGNAENPRLKQLCCFLIDKLAEYIGSYLLQHVEIVWSILSPVLDLRNYHRDQDRTATIISSGNAVISLLHEIPDDELHLERYSCLKSGLHSLCQLLVSSIEANDENSLSDISEGFNRLVKVKPILFQDCYQIIFEVTKRICQDEDAADSLKCSLLELSVELITNPTSSQYCSTAESRHFMLTICFTVMCQIVISDDGSDPFSSYHSSWTPFSDDEFGDEDGSENHSTGLATYSLHKLYQVFPIEESLSSMSTISNLFNEPSIGCIRTGLLITSILYEVLGAEMQQMTSKIFPIVLQCTNRPTPRVRICAFHCLQTIISSSITISRENCHDDEDGNDNDNDNEEDEEEIDNSIPPFFKQYASAYLSTSMNSLRENQHYPRVIFAILNSLRSFCDPQSCPPSVMENISGNLLMVLWNILRTSEYPVIVLSEAVSLAGNVSLLSSEDVLSACYPHFMGYLKSTVSNNDSHIGLAAIQMSKLKGKCLEAAALLGRAVGMQVFQEDAQELMQWICSAHQAGLDFSDPLASYMVQTAARFAGIYGAEFQPYLQYLLPPLLHHIQEDLSVDILTEGEHASDQNEFGTEEYTVYKRGVGNVRIVHSSYQVTEREMSCRALYQYLLDIPDVIFIYIPEIIQSVTTVASLFMTEEMCLIVGTLLSDSLKFYLRYSQPNIQNVATVNHLTEKSLESLLGLLRFCHRTQNSSTEKEQTQVIQIIIDSLREFLKVFAECKKGLTGWQDISLRPDLVKECSQLIVNEASRWVERIYRRNYRREEATPGLEVEEALWLSLSDSAGWLVKASPTSQTAVIFSDEILPFLLGLLQASEHAIPLLSMSLSVMLDALDVLPSQSIHLPPDFPLSFPHFMLTQCFQYLPKEELRDDCLYGFGVCSKSGDPSFSAHFQEIIEAIRPFLAALDESECEDEELRLRDIAIGSMFKIALYHPTPYSSQILSSCFHHFPLTGDHFTAKEIHFLFLHSLLNGNLTLLGGESFQLLEVCLVTCFKLLVMNQELLKDLTEEGEGATPHEVNENYENHCLCYFKTRDDLQFLRKSRFIENVDEKLVEKMIQSNEDIRLFFSWREG